MPQFDYTINIGNVVTIAVLAFGMLASWFHLRAKVDGISEWRGETTVKVKEVDDWKNDTNQRLMRTVTILDGLERRVAKIEDNR